MYTSSKKYSEKLRPLNIFRFCYRIPAILDLMAAHGVQYSSFVYNVLISWRGSEVGVAAAEACYREAEAAGKLDGVSVSSMLAVYDVHGMVRKITQGGVFASGYYQYVMK